MQLIDNFSQAYINIESFITIGAFDGVHRGHQHLIRTLVREAHEKGFLAGLVTFHPHPSVVLNPSNPTRYLTTPGEKVSILEKMDLDLVAILPFDEKMARTPAREFIGLLCKHLNLKELWVGADFALGFRREGNVEVLKELGREMGFMVRVVEPLYFKGEIISSTRIRKLIALGEVREAAQLLGRYYSLAGEVVRGEGRGRSLGFPTANLEVRPERVIPADGVYVTYVRVGRDRLWGVTNVGIRPTFDGGKRLVETYILNFEGDLYGYDLVVEFVERLRPEMKFPSVEELTRQIREDVEKALRILEREEALGGIENMLEPVYTPSIKRFEELPHTADKAIKVYGSTLEDIFVNAAFGMFSLMVDPQEIKVEVTRELELSSFDTESLLVKWLNELLYLHEIEGELYRDFEIVYLDEKSLKARVWGGKGYPTKAKVKAATYHHLEIRDVGKGYEATVVFDT
ncbi:MAG: bifunctional riboflavin kinase/FAD synthetase [Anaerolineae bacterium]|nr:bifunctional riboflavin kinase/FAD synthetase [Anaerolineae bacterium]MDW8101348.1 bifunctional riboflavin kinase/FAD synthetase [Anaerolineae bacterium]